MNKLWRLGNKLSKRGGVARKVSRILELTNHLICACSVAIDTEIGEGTTFFHRGVGCAINTLKSVRHAKEKINFLK